MEKELLKITQFLDDGTRGVANVRVSIQNDREAQIVASALAHLMREHDELLGLFIALLGEAVLKPEEYDKRVTTVTNAPWMGGARGDNNDNQENDR